MKAHVSGVYKFECYNPDGSLAWEEEVKNGITIPGINDMESVYFAAGTQKPTWFMGLIDNTGFSALASTDTMASHPGWVEQTTGYTAPRPTWVPAVPSGGAITTNGTVNFTAIAACSIKGGFICSNNTLGGTTGILWSTGLLSAVQTLAIGQILKITYTCTITPTS